MARLSHFTTRSNEEDLFRIGGSAEYQADVETAAFDGFSSVQTYRDQGIFRRHSVTICCRWARVRTELPRSERFTREPQSRWCSEHSQDCLVALSLFATAMRDFREQHMRAWIDDSIPALGGLTPRAAARSPRSRAALDTLLKQFDQSEARLPPEERIDLSWLRVELGMNAP